MPIGAAPLDHPTPTDTTTQADLTISEWRVVALAARGETNRDIARKLHITVSTVEQHLTRVYRKLGVTGRRELPLHYHMVAPYQGP